jgi:type I restriction enzyme S subunit
MSEIQNTDFTLPNGWQWVKLGEVCEFLDSMRIPVNETERQRRVAGKSESKLYPYYGANGQVGWIDNYIFDEELVLLAEDGGFFGSIERPIAYRVSGKCWVNNHAHVLRPKGDIIDGNWLYFTLAIRPDIVRFVSGTTRLKLNQEQASLIPVSLPPLSEQKRIAAKIQELMQEVERARTACEKQLEAAKALPAVYLREVFESEETKKWKRKKLGEVLGSIESGGRPKGGVFEIKEGVPSVGAEHLNSFGGFNFDNMRFIPQDFYGKIRRGRIQKRDVLVVKDGATTGKVSFVGDDFPFSHAAINEHVFKLRSKEFLEQEFLFWFLYSPLGQIQIQQEFHGAAQGGINQKFVNGVYILIPSLSTQKRITAELKEKMPEVERLRTGVEKQLGNINALPQAILRKAFRGKLSI